jgi:hypothetical protein
MKKTWYSILPWMSLISGLLVIVLLVLGVVMMPSKKNENTANRKVVLDKLKQIQVDSTEINSRAFFEYFDKTLSCSLIDTKWLISDKGEIIYANGMMAPSTPLHSNAYNIEDAQSRGLISAVESNIDSIQKCTMLIAARIRSEGEHNDILGHLVVPLKSSSGVLVGFAGVAYNLDDKNQSYQYYQFIIMALGICFLSYWLLLPLWVYFDSRERNNKYVLWTLFVLIGNLPAYIAYLLARK